METFDIFVQCPINLASVCETSQLMHRLRTLHWEENEMPNDKFAHYLDDQGLHKKLDHFEALKLSKNEYSKLSPDELRAHIKKLYLEYHPDKNPADTIRAGESFKRIKAAVDVITDPEQCKRYMTEVSRSYATDLGGFAASTFDDDMNDLNNFFDIKIRQIKEWSRRLDSLANLSHVSEIQPESAEPDSIKKIVGETTANFMGLVSTEVAEAQNELLIKLIERAQTADDFYALSHMHTRSTPWFQLECDSFLCKAANQGHLIAMREVAGSILTGRFKSDPDNTVAISWALNCIRYIEAVAIPQLQNSASETDEKSLVKLQAGLSRTRERISNEYTTYPNKTIPAPGTLEFTQLTASLVTKLSSTRTDYQVPRLTESPAVVESTQAVVAKPKGILKASKSPNSTAKKNAVHFGDGVKAHDGRDGTTANPAANPTVNPVVGPLNNEDGEDSVDNIKTKKLKKS